MRDCFDILITKYYAALNGNITYNSANVPIYDRVPKNTTFPYIIFQSYTGVDESNKSNYMKEVTVTVQVVTGFDLEQGGKEESDNIADQILQIIRERPDNLLDLSPNFNLINVSVDDTSSYEQTTETHLIVYRNIRFRHKVEQLTDYFNTNFLCATAKPTNLTATAVSTSQINLSWTDNSGGAATFSIERSTTYVNGFTVIATPVAGTTVYNDTGLVAGTTYFYRIRALDTCYSRYSDIAFDCTETSGGACADATAVLKDTVGSTISTTTIASGGTENITAPDGVVTITDTTPSTLYTVNVKSNGTETQAIADSVITLNNSVPTLISTTNVKAEATATIAAPDATAVIKDSAGTTLKTEAIPSNVSENITINDCTVTVNGNSFDTILAEGSIDVPVEYVNGTPVGTIVSGVVEIPNPITPSGIVYQRPSLSGQLTSYRTGDDAWHLANGTYNYTPPTNPSSVAQLDTAHATPFLMLKKNNVFGNKNRFTDDGGNQTYANDYVIDHLTGLGWYRLTQGASTNWSDNIDAAEASSILSYTDWRMANIKEYDSIGNRSMVGFNYAPFNLTGSPISVYQTSTTDSNNTANYVRYQITTFIQQSSDAKTTALASRAMLLVRNHY